MLLNIQYAKDHCFFIFLLLLSFYVDLTKNISYIYIVLFTKMSWSLVEEQYKK